MSNMEPLLRPKSVAVIGATSRPGSVGQAVFGNVLQHSYAGVVYPVNPRAASVMSVKAFPSVLDIPDPVDLGIIIVPRDGVPGVMQECGQKGIKGLMVITSGFAESGQFPGDSMGSRLHFSQKVRLPEKYELCRRDPYASFDTLGDEIEEPFGMLPNDLALSSMCRTIERDLLAALGACPVDVRCWQVLCRAGDSNGPT